MKDPKKIPQEPQTSEQEILRGRKFELSEALARQAAGALKGASPVTLAKQLLLAVDNLLERHLPDGEGSLARVIIVRLETDPPLLARHFGDPAGVLSEFSRQILESQQALDELVRQADARWGRDYDERPLFNSPQGPVHPDDPYTPDSVRASLEALLRAIE